MDQGVLDKLAEIVSKRWSVNGTVLTGGQVALVYDALPNMEEVHAILTYAEGLVDYDRRRDRALKVLKDADLIAYDKSTKTWRRLAPAAPEEGASVDGGTEAPTDTQESTASIEADDVGDVDVTGRGMLERRLLADREATAAQEPDQTINQSSILAVLRGIDHEEATRPLRAFPAMVGTMEMQDGEVAAVYDFNTQHPDDLATRLRLHERVAVSTPDYEISVIGNGAAYIPGIEDIVDFATKNIMAPRDDLDAQMGKMAAHLRSDDHGPKNRAQRRAAEKQARRATGRAGRRARF